VRLKAAFCELVRGAQPCDPSAENGNVRLQSLILRCPDHIRATLDLMKGADFRRIALSLPEAVEGSHMGHADFRVGGKIFATLGLEKEGYGVLVLTPEQQAGMVEDAPEIFSPVPGGWGRQGSTRVRLAKVKPDILEAALRVAWRRRAPARLTR
jgi:hypothetical protein